MLAAAVGACTAAPPDTGSGGDSGSSNVGVAAEYCADLIACGLQLDGLQLGECVELAAGVGDECALVLDLCSFPCEGFVECVEVHDCEAYGSR